MYARSHHADDLVDRVQGVRIASRIPCDGATNPQDELGLETTFSPAGWQRAFHLDVFESQYCKRLDLYFFCVTHGHDRWKHDWAKDNRGTGGSGRYWIDTCAAWGSKDAQEYILSGWYRETAAEERPVEAGDHQESLRHPRDLRIHGSQWRNGAD